MFRCLIGLDWIGLDNGVCGRVLGCLLLATATATAILISRRYDLVGCVVEFGRWLYIAYLGVLGLLLEH
jgi:hypothetical protein